MHSVPDHKFPAAAAPNQTFQFSVDVPGNVEVELHHLDRTIATIQVQAMTARRWSSRTVSVVRVTFRSRTPTRWSGAAWALTFTFALVAFAWRRPRFDPLKPGHAPCPRG